MWIKNLNISTDAKFCVSTLTTLNNPNQSSVKFVGVVARNDPTKKQP